MHAWVIMYSVYQPYKVDMTICRSWMSSHVQCKLAFATRKPFQSIIITNISFAMKADRWSKEHHNFICHSSCLDTGWHPQAVTTLLSWALVDQLTQPTDQLCEDWRSVNINSTVLSLHKQYSDHQPCKAKAYTSNIFSHHLEVAPCITECSKTLPYVFVLVTWVFNFSSII